MLYFFFFFQAEDGIRDIGVTGVQTCALPIWCPRRRPLAVPVTGVVGRSPDLLEPIGTSRATLFPVIMNAVVDRSAPFGDRCPVVRAVGVATVVCASLASGRESRRGGSRG